MHKNLIVLLAAVLELACGSVSSPHSDATQGLRNLPPEIVRMHQASIREAERFCRSAHERYVESGKRHWIDCIALKTTASMEIDIYQYPAPRVATDSENDSQAWHDFAYLMSSVPTMWCTGHKYGVRGSDPSLEMRDHVDGIFTAANSCKLMESAQSTR